MKQKLSIIFGIVLFTALVTGLALAEYSQEIKNAYNWAFNYEITTQPTIEDAKLDKDITRQAMAKMIVNFSEKYLGRAPDNYKECEFSDPDGTENLKPYIKEACQLGLMGQNTNIFKPMDSVTYAQFWVMLSRALWWNTYEWSTPYYLAHLTALQEAWILDYIPNPTETTITRGEVILSLKKSADITWKGVLALDNNTNKNKETFYPEIEYLMNKKKLSEDEKQIIRKEVNENEKNLYNIVELLELPTDDEFIFNNKEVTKFIKTITTYKDKTLPDYISTLKNIYSTLWIDLTDKSPYTPWEKIEKIETFSSTTSKYIDTCVEIISFFNAIATNATIWEDWNLIFTDDEIENKINEKMEELYIKRETTKEEYDEALEKFVNYIEEYQNNNIHRMEYEWELERKEIEYDIKNAKFKDWIYTWEDWTSYQGEVSNWKLNGKWILTSPAEFTYSWEFKNNMFNWFWEMKKDENNYYIGYTKNGQPNWLGFLVINWETYSWSFINGNKHWYWETTTSEYSFKWTRNNNRMKEWTLTYKNWDIYSWEIDNYANMNWYWTLILSWGDIFNWNFSHNIVNWEGTLTLKSWEKYSWEWINWYLSWKNIYFWDGKIVRWDNISITENPWNNTIIVSDWTDNLTIMNKNIWADESGTWASSFWSMFKRWNNTPFSSTSTWDSDNFRAAKNWKWNEKDQGPCPNGYHIPTEQERKWLINLFHLKQGYEHQKWILLSWEFVLDFSQTFELPFSGIRKYINEEDSQYLQKNINLNNQEKINELLNDRFYYQEGNKEDTSLIWRYWISWWGKYLEIAINKDTKWELFWSFYTSEQGYEDSWMTVRCFKN